MKVNNKIITACLTASAAVSSIVLLNKWIFLSSNKGLLPRNRFSYDWRFGSISYHVSGKGKPLLLIHDLLPGSSDIEWNSLVEKLSISHTIYSLDLLGFGRSDKPAITYTNYLYVQLITDFIKSVIGRRTDVIASGSSSSVAVMSCCNDHALFDRMILVNPDSPKIAGQIPNKRSKMQKFLIDCPVFGTLLYNIMMSKLFLNKDLSKHYLSASCRQNDLVCSFHEAAHIGGCRSKYIYSSIIGNYTNFSISHKISEIDNSILLIGGMMEESITDTIQYYKELNPAIESSYMKGCRHFPQIEKPEDFLQLCQIFLSSTI